MDREPSFTKVLLFTDRDGRAKWREERMALGEGSPQARLSALLPASGFQLRHSPVGFRSDFHCTPKPQWVFILGGEMEIARAVLALVESDFITGETIRVDGGRHLR